MMEVICGKVLVKSQTIRSFGIKEFSGHSDFPFVGIHMPFANVSGIVVVIIQRCKGLVVGIHLIH